MRRRAHSLVAKQVQPDLQANLDWNYCSSGQGWGCGDGLNWRKISTTRMIKDVIQLEYELTFDHNTAI